MSLYSMEKYCPGDFKKYKTISVGCLWAEQFAIKVDQFYRDFKKSRVFIIFKKSRWNRSSLIANCSAPRQPTEMVLYFLKSPGQYFSIEYKLISVGCLWAEQFAIKLAVIFPKIQKLFFTLFLGGQGGPLIYTFDLFEV